MPQYPIPRVENTYVGNAILSGAIVDIDLKDGDTNMPANVTVKNTQYRVDEQITSGDGAESWNAELIDGASEMICSGQSFDKNTKGHKPTVGIVLSAVTKIRVTPNTGTFSGGKVSFACQVDQYNDLDDLP